MNKIKLLLVDDEPLAHRLLETYIEKIDFLEIVGNCYDALSTINFLNQERVDAILLDIQLPDLSGLELLDTLQRDTPKIIFTTAFTEFALQSFNYEQVIDYLHKPIRLSRFLKAMERLKKQLTLEQNLQQKKPSEQPQANVHSDFISIKENKIFFKIPLADILYIQAWGNYLKFFLKGDKMHLARKTIKEVEAELPSQHFERIHKSYIVNIQAVKAIRGNQVILDKLHLPIGKSYTVKSKERLLGN